VRKSVRQTLHNHGLRYALAGHPHDDILHVRSLEDGWYGWFNREDVEVSYDFVS
jgi:hypothetical protein